MTYSDAFYSDLIRLIGLKKEKEKKHFTTAVLILFFSSSFILVKFVRF